MSTTTPKLGLIKPDGGDYVDVNDLNANFDKIDNMTAADVGALPISGGTASGEITVETNSSPSLHARVKGTTKRCSLIRNATTSLDYGTKVVDEVEGNNKTALILATTNSLIEKAVLEVTESGNATQYNLYGEHNKKLLTEDEKTLEFRSGITGLSKYFKNADSTVYVEGKITLQSISASTWTAIGDLPVGYRPNGTKYFAGTMNTGTTNVPIFGVIEESGEIYIYSKVGSSTACDVYINFAIKSA